MLLKAEVLRIVRDKAWRNVLQRNWLCDRDVLQRGGKVSIHFAVRCELKLLLFEMRKEPLHTASINLLVIFRKEQSASHLFYIGLFVTHIHKVTAVHFRNL